MLIGVKNLFIALPLSFVKRFTHIYSGITDSNTMLIHHVSSFFIGVLMLLLAYRLYKRIRLAWLIEIFFLVATLMLHIIRHQSISLQFVAIELFVLIVLLEIGRAHV